MAIKWEFENYTTDGSQFISLDQWVATLSEEEQEIYKKADKRQKSYRQEKVTEGKLEVVQDGYIWENEEAEKINKEIDPIWSDYFFRWQQETKSSVRLTRKEI